VNIDCVVHGPLDLKAGETVWNTRVRAGGSVRGRVVDAHGAPVLAAVVSGGGNWTPSNEDGSFWLDNIDQGPFLLEVAHHAHATLRVPGVQAGTEDLELVLDRPLPRVTLEVTDPEGAPVSLVAIDWLWPPGRGPGLFVPDSRYWNDPGGRYALIVPEGVSGARVTDDAGRTVTLTAAQLADGATLPLVLAPPPAPEPGAGEAGLEEGH
jgi:hypothetical protein